jgi:hypothetical protein
MGVFSTGNSSVDDAVDAGLAGIFGQVQNRVIKLLPGGATSGQARGAVQGTAQVTNPIIPAGVRSDVMEFFRKPIVIIGAVVVVLGLVWVLVRGRK